MKSFASYSGTNDTVPPPQPAPVSLLPKAPFCLANFVKISIYSDEHSYKSLQES